MKKQILSTITAASTFLLVVPFSVHAQIINASRVSSATGLGTTGPVTTSANLINAALGLLAITAVAIIVYAGFKWLTSAGNTEKVDSAKRTLIAATIGLLIILGSLGISIFVFGQIENATGFIG